MTPRAMKCRHKSQSYTGARVFGSLTCNAVVFESGNAGHLVVGALRCDRCGTYLSLGPAGDGGEFAEQVRVEQRAAEVAEAFMARDNEALMATTSFIERRGFAMHAKEEGDWTPLTNGAKAGWLAREILDTDDDHDAGQGEG